MKRRAGKRTVPEPPASSAALRRARDRGDMRVSVVEGLVSQLFLSLGGPGSVFFTALALSLGAGDREMGVIFTAGPIFQGAQVLGPMLISAFRGSRRGVVIAAGGVARLLVLAIPVIIFLLPPRGALAAVVVVWLVAQGFTGIASNVWTSWIGDTVPERVRGRWLGRRTQLVILVGLLASFGASLLKDLAAPGTGAGLTGWLRRVLGLGGGFFGPGGDKLAFALIFAFAALAGLGALFILRRQGDRPAPSYRFRPADLAVPFRDPRFRPFLVQYGVWFFAIYFGSPFWQPFFIGELGMSLTAIQVYGTISTVAMAAAVAFTGRLLDRFGNKPVLRAMMLLSVVNAFVYVFMTRDRYWWMWLEAVTSGVMWGGAGVATTNLLLRLSPSERRDSYVAAFALVTGAAGLVSTIASGQFIGALPKYVVIGGLTFVNMKAAFAVSAALRVVAQIPMYRVREPRAAGFRHMVGAVAGDARAAVLRWLPPFFSK